MKTMPRILKQGIILSLSTCGAVRQVGIFISYWIATPISIAMKNNWMYKNLQQISLGISGRNNLT